MSANLAPPPARFGVVAALALLTGVGALSGAIGALCVLDGVYFWLFPKRNPLYEQLQRQKDLRL